MKVKVLAMSIGILLIAISAVFLYQSNSRKEKAITSYIVPEKVTREIERPGMITRVAPLPKPKLEDKTSKIPIDHTPIVHQINDVLNVPEESPITEVEDLSEVVIDIPMTPPELEFNLTLAEVAAEHGLSESQLQEITEFLPIDLNVNIASPSFIEMIDRIGRAIDDKMHEAMNSMDLREARVVLEILKNDPEVSDEDFQLLVNDYLPNNLKRDLQP